MKVKIIKNARGALLRLNACYASNPYYLNWIIPAEGSMITPLFLGIVGSTFRNETSSWRTNMSKGGFFYGVFFTGFKWRRSI